MSRTPHGLEGVEGGKSADHFLRTSVESQDELVELFAEIAESYDEQTIWRVYAKVKAREAEAVHNAFCWVQKPGEYIACDRASGHSGYHSWELSTTPGGES